MTHLDYTVLGVYLLAMFLIGLVSMLQIKKQEDFFLGSRGFGKILQAFAAFGAGTGSHDPVTVGRTTFTSGLSGIWSVLLWLFVTPFYWIAGVWYRRMRHLTLGDWFVERYQTTSMGTAYALFGLVFYMVSLAVGFSAIGKVGAPLVGVDQVNLPLFGAMSVEVFLVLVCAGVVMVYGVAGGLRAAYWTDLIQGIFIILLSVLLIPAGLNALIEKFGNPETMSMIDGFQVMHQQVASEYFEILNSPRGGEFPWHYVVAITLLNLVGIVVQPHFIATGGGSAKSETSARIGLVAGNFMKRFCTIGWAITCLIVLALMADNVELTKDPDRVWGVAAREILGPFNLGLVGLMLACLMAALMSSASCYMLVTSGLVIRNFFAPYILPNASEKAYVQAGRVVGVLVIAGGAWVSIAHMDVFEQLKMVWEMPILFAAPFWLGMYWRRATRPAAWMTLAFTFLAFFALPWFIPQVMPSLAENPRFAVANDLVTTTVERRAVPADVARRKATRTLWDQGDKSIRAKYPEKPETLQLGKMTKDEFTTGGKAIYWKGGVSPLNQKRLREVSRLEEGNLLEVRQQYDCKLQGSGDFQFDFFIYEAMGIDLTKFSNAALETLRLPTRLILPFIVMIFLSLVTSPVDKKALDRYYVKMKTPVAPDPEQDKAELEASYNDPSRFDDRRLFKCFGLEFQRPTLLDAGGFVLSFLVCFAIIGFTIWLAKLGS